MKEIEKEILSTWIYKNSDSMLVTETEAARAFKNGWKDCPVKAKEAENKANKAKEAN